jgi:hypothetical protein
MRQSRHNRSKLRKGAKAREKGLSPEVWKLISKTLPGIIKAVAALIDAISRLH